MVILVPSSSCDLKAQLVLIMSQCVGLSIRLGPFLRPDAPKGEMLHLSGFPDADADVLALSYRAEDVACRSGSTAWAFMGNGFASYSFPAARVASIP